MRLLLLCAIGVLSAPVPSAEEPAPFQTTGIKIGEVTDSQAIVWTRLTRLPDRVRADAPVPVVRYKNPETGALEEKPGRQQDWTPVVEFPVGVSVDGLEGAAPGSPGEVRVRYQRDQDTDWQDTGWAPVEPERDFTHPFILTALQPGTLYRLRVESRSLDRQAQGETVEGQFRTAPGPEEAARVTFTVSTGQAYPDRDLPGEGFKIYPSMLANPPDFFVHTGDILYYDQLAKSLELARWHWARMYSLPTNVAFHRQVPAYFIKDDHDTWMNDCYPAQQSKFMGEFTFAQGQAVFLEQVPMGRRTYRTVRWGKDLQLWFVEGRDFRSANDDPDGPAKTIWGEEQKTWFKQTVHDSDAAFRVLISPTPIVGPDRDSKNDNHANKGFAHEGSELRAFIAQQKGMFVICGDRHWQYVSVDEETGLREYSCGPASDRHAGGWSNDKILPEHRYLNVIGGFLRVTVDRPDGKPVMLLEHCGVNGNVLHEERLPDSR